MPGAWPEGDFDLIVFSEILYYFAGEDLGRMLDLAVTSLRPAGTLLAVHWRHPVADYPRSGDEVHSALRGRRAAGPNGRSPGGRLPGRGLHPQ